MNSRITKYKFIVAIVLIVVLSAFSMPAEIYDIDYEVNNALPVKNTMFFSKTDLMCSFYISEKVNAFKENFVAEHKSKRNTNLFDNNTVYVRDLMVKKPFVDYKIDILPFYVMVCVLLILEVIRYIDDKDGKKRTSYLKMI